MKSVSRILFALFCIAPCAAMAAPVPNTVGSNLTAFNPSGSANNNNWNTMMNSRTASGAAPTADFGNCNSVIMRCAQPKCASGGCTTMDVTMPIVSGCVLASDACKQYGDDLTQYIAAQLVASSTARANEQALAAQTAAANAAAAQSAQQLQQMQSQMQQMQQQMAAQNAQQIQQMQAALDEQKQLTAQAIADANAAAQNAAAAPTAIATDAGVSSAQVAAAQNGVSADILVRQQVSGEIMSKIESAQVALKEMKTAMQDAFEYAGCDSTGNNCTGPKRVKMFKQRAQKFFDPYETALSELYDGLITAQAVGVDITDIYMMLNDSCNVWGEYLCNVNTSVTNGVRQIQNQTYNSTTCVNGRSVRTSTTRGGYDCIVGSVVPVEDDAGCVLQRTLTDKDEVRRNFLYADEGSNDTMIRVGCASSALQSSGLFRNMKKQSSIDMEILQRMIEQDAPATLATNRFSDGKETIQQRALKYCAIGADTYDELQRAVSLKKLPGTICVNDASLKTTLENNGVLSNGADKNYSASAIAAQCGVLSDDVQRKICLCRRYDEAAWINNGCVCDDSAKVFDFNSISCIAKNATADKARTETVTRTLNVANTCATTGGHLDVNTGKCLCNGWREYDPETENCNDILTKKFTFDVPKIEASSFNKVLVSK